MTAKSLTPVGGAGPSYEATFDTPGKAWAAANALMPRRKHNRPYPVRSGYHSARAPLGAHRWIVMVGNAVLMESGAMFDYQLNRFVTKPIPAAVERERIVERVSGEAVRIPAKPEPYTCPVCNDLDPLCLIVTCEERLRVVERSR